MFILRILLLLALEHGHKKAISVILFWICIGMHIPHHFRQKLCTAISTVTARQACTSSLHKPLFRIQQQKHMHWNHEAHVSIKCEHISDHATCCQQTVFLVKAAFNPSVDLTPVSRMQRSKTCLLVSDADDLAAMGGLFWASQAGGAPVQTPTHPHIPGLLSPPARSQCHALSMLSRQGAAAWAE